MGPCPRHPDAGILPSEGHRDIDHKALIEFEILDVVGPIQHAVLCLGGEGYPLVEHAAKVTKWDKVTMRLSMGGQAPRESGT